MNVIGRFLILVFFLGCSPTWAEWQLVPDKSHLSFVSTKKQHIAESHTFKGLQGSVDNDSVGTVAVDLASVDTKIEIRDERMRETLFETKEYPTAVFTTHVDPMRVRSI
ncbi:MAG: YceI family protein, partial [Sedimenticolaceae bacterium]